MRHSPGKPVPSLAKEHFFRGINPDVAARLDTFAYHRNYEPRQIIYFPDDTCDYVYWVRSGRVKITHVSGKGRELAFRHLFKGDIFGEECLVKKLRHNDYAEAMTNTTLTLVRSGDFARIAKEESELSYAVACHSCRRAMALETVLSEFVFAEVRQRVASRLWQFYCIEHRDGGDNLPLTHQELANLVGAARETVTGVLHDLQDQGIVVLGNRSIQVANASGLQRAAETK